VIDSSKNIGIIHDISIDGVFAHTKYSFDNSGNLITLGDISSNQITTNILRATNIESSLNALAETSNNHFHLINELSNSLVNTDISVNLLLTDVTDLSSRAYIIDSSITTIELSLNALTQGNTENTITAVTPGIAAANKALVLDSSKNIGTIHDISIDGVFVHANSYRFDANGDVSGLRNISFTNNLLPINNTAQLPVSYSSCILKNISGDDLSNDFNTWIDASNFQLSKELISEYSYVKIEIRANYICSLEADEKISFRVLRKKQDTEFDENDYNQQVFTDTLLGSNFGINIKNVYYASFIDEPYKNQYGNKLTYKLQYKLDSYDTPNIEYGIVDGGNYFFLQEIYRPMNP